MKEVNAFIGSEFKQNTFFRIISLLFIAISIWWLSIYVRGLQEGTENNYYTLIYPLLSLAGGIFGLFVSKKCGGMKSYLGKTLLMFSLGLLAQFFGQLCYAYYIYILNIEVPYPSIGDLGFFGSIIFYIIGITYLARVLGVKLSLNSLKAQLFAFFVPALLLIFSYYMFLVGYEFDTTSPLRTFLDFGYPLGQAIYVSLAILTYLLSRNRLGGIMKHPVIFLIIALLVQYFSDSMFLYEVSRGTWYVGGTNDFLYSVSYYLMIFGLVYISSIISRIRDSK